MDIVIKIDDDMAKAIEQGSFEEKYNIYDLIGCIMNGTPLPKGVLESIANKGVNTL